MAGRKKGSRGDAVDELFRTEVKTYHKQIGIALEQRKILHDRAENERRIREILKGKSPPPGCEALMHRAYRLEDCGQLAEAADAYQRVLALPGQADNHELRQHITQLLARVHRQQAAAKAVARQSELAVRQVPAGDVVGALLRPGAAGPGPGGSGAGPEGSPARRLRAPGRPAGAGGEGPVAAGGAAGRAPHALNPRRAVGPSMPMSPEGYRAELAAQAMEVRRRRAAAAREAELVEQKQVAVAAAMEALEKHRQHVVGRNDRQSYANDLERERLARQDDRQRRYYLEWEQLQAAKAAGGLAGPLGGEDEYDRRRREQVQAAHAHRALARNAWEDPADPVRQYHDAYGYGSVLREDQQYFQPSRAVPGYARPASAGSVTAAMDALARERERERYRQAVNDVNVSRHFVPGHPQDYNAVGYGAGSPGGRPRRPATAGGRVAAAAAAAAGRGGDVGRPGGAPFDRPNVDRPVTAIDPRVVRAKQQAFVDKRRKPVSEPRAVDQVPLRVRRAEGRRPSPPRVAEGALDGWNGWPVPVPVP